MQIVKNELKHFENGTSKKLNAALYISGILIWNLNEPLCADVTSRYDLNLTQCRKIYHGPRRMEPRHYKIVEIDIRRMLQAGIIVSALSY